MSIFELSSNAANVGYITSMAIGLLLTLTLFLRARFAQPLLFGIITFSFTLWILFNFLADNFRVFVYVDIFSKVAIIPPLLAFPLIYEFAKTFPSSTYKTNFFNLLRNLMLALPLIILAPTDLNVKVTELTDFSPKIEVGPLYIGMGAYILFWLMLALWHLFRHRNEIYGIEKRQLQYIGYGFMATLVMGAIFTLILPIFDITSTTFLGPSSSVLFLFASTYALIRYRMFGIRIFIAQFINGVIIAAFLVLLFLLISYAQIRLWGSVFDVRAIISGFLIAPLAYFLLIKVNEFVQDLLNRSIISNIHKATQELEKLQDVTSTSKSMNEIEIAIFERFSKILNIKALHMIVYDAEGDIVYADDQNPKLLDHNIFKEHARQLTDLLIIEEIEIKKELTENETYFKDFMTKEEADLIVPIRFKGSVFGLLLITFNEANETVRAEEIRIIQEIGRIASVSAARATLFNEIENFNKILQNKIDLSTQELQKQLETIQQLRAKEHDMMDIMGHELRTPMSIIKLQSGLLRMNLEATKDLSPESKDKLMQNYKKLHDAAEREIGLINTLLSATKVDAGKLQLNKEGLSIVEMIETGYEGHKAELDRKPIQFIFEPPAGSEKWLVYGDKVRLQEVVDNLISNATKYTNKGEIRIELENDGQFVTVHIKDTGIGIPDAARKHLGEKFFRVSQYIQRKNGEDANVIRPGGTGLGLYVTFGLVEQHGGKIWVDSQEGVGSTFHFTVPVYNEARARYDSEMQEEMGPSKNIFEKLKMDEQINSPQQEKSLQDLIKEGQQTQGSVESQSGDKI